jgi:uncharacterized damage-inducible protein DinB
VLSETGLPFRCVKRWFDRSFPLGIAVGEAPALLARLSRTADRTAAALDAVPGHVRLYKAEGRWSMQEHAGHLLDLEPLWSHRLDDFERGTPVLHAADLQNRQTHEARHNDRPAAGLIEGFRSARTAILRRLSVMTPAELARVSRHPRLAQPMSVVDLCYFVAEHDDHHLAAMKENADRFGSWPACALALIDAVDSAVPWLQTLDDDSTAQRPGAAKWSPREILGHLIDSAANNHQRFVRGQWQPDLVFAGYDQDAWVEAQQYQAAPWLELVTLWASYNRHLARVMGATPISFRQTSHTNHSFDGVPAGEPATLQHFMDDYVRHLEHHLIQIRDHVTA